MIKFKKNGEYIYEEDKALWRVSGDILADYGIVTNKHDIGYQIAKYYWGMVKHHIRSGSRVYLWGVGTFWIGQKKAQMRYNPLRKEMKYMKERPKLRVKACRYFTRHSKEWADLEAEAKTRIGGVIYLASTKGKEISRFHLAEGLVRRYGLTRRKAHQICIACNMGMAKSLFIHRTVHWKGIPNINYRDPIGAHKKFGIIYRWLSIHEPQWWRVKMRETEFVKVGEDDLKIVADLPPYDPENIKYPLYYCGVDGKYFRSDKWIDKKPVVRRQVKKKKTKKDPNVIGGIRVEKVAC